MTKTETYCDMCKKKTSWDSHSMRIEHYLTFRSYSIEFKKHDYELCKECYKKVANFVEENTK